MQMQTTTTSPPLSHVSIKQLLTFLRTCFTGFNMLTIGMCGAHGTGKTTLLQELSPYLTVSELSRTMRDMWEKFGIADFEKLPPDVRATFQRYAILRQIEREDAQQNGFITDRTVMDNLGYTKLSTDMTESELLMYEALVRERVKKYSHFIYVPIEFEAENEFLRADVSSRQEFAKIVESYLEEWFTPGQYLIVRGSLEDRVAQVLQFLGIS